MTTSTSVLTPDQLIAIRAELALALIEIHKKHKVMLQVGEIKQTTQLRGKLHRVDFSIAQ